MATIDGYTMTAWEGTLADPELRSTILEPSPGQDGAVVLFGGYRYDEAELRTVSVHETVALANAAVANYKAAQSTSVTIVTPAGRIWTSCIVMSSRSREPFLDAVGNWLVRTDWKILVPLQS